MRFGVFTSLTLQTWPGVLDLWQHLEATGWDIACVSDHFMPNTKDREGAVLESWSTLSGLAAVVPRIRIGTIVLGNTFANAGLVACPDSLVMVENLMLFNKMFTVQS